jgi:hypothetical protein
MRDMKCYMYHGERDLRNWIQLNQGRPKRDTMALMTQSMARSVTGWRCGQAAAPYQFGGCYLEMVGGARW